MNRLHPQMTSYKTFLIALCLLLPTAAQAQLPVGKLIATGGTIAMKIDPVKKAPVPAISGEDLVATVPQIGKVATIEVENLSNVPSDYMDPERWCERRPMPGRKGL